MASCVWLPGFELQLERARDAALEGVPLALCDTGAGTRRFVEQCCTLAISQGVRPGILVSQAIALCPSVALLEQDPDFYDAARHRVLDVLRRWSPVVEVSAERGRVFIGVDGLERLYGPADRQMADLRRRIRAAFPPRCIADVRLGYAPGKFAARVAANSARPGESVLVTRRDLVAFLSSQPVGVLPVSPRMIRRLERLGVERLDRLIEIPEPALVAQFGADGRRALAWARGERVDPVVPTEVERPIRVSVEFPIPIGQLEMVHAAIDRLLGKALERSRKSGRSVRGVRVSARLEDAGSWSVRGVLRDPTSRADALGAFIRSRIALAPPTRAVEDLELEFFRFGSATSQVDLFAPKENAPRARGSIETAEGDVLPELRRASRHLELRMGEGMLYRVLELQPDSRIPERRHALLELAS
ncbi:MAG: hypothetical protein R3195_19685 [Gemmatimonadota bacterium]|nr:hypothetical protein [Gemmatimonadota bacterium]